MKKKLLVLLVLAPIAAICYICGSIGWAFFVPSVLKPLQMKQALKAYDGATYLFEETDKDRPHTDQTTVYYWSADPLDKVKASYEKTGQKFFPGTSQLDWWITAYDKDGTLQEFPSASLYGITDHPSICEMPFVVNLPRVTDDKTEIARLDALGTKEYGCISITLVKADHPSLCTLPAVFPAGRWQMIDKTPYKNCSRFPKQGTLIIFNYYMEAM